MHLVLPTCARARATITMTADEANTSRAPPEGTTAPRMWEAFREPVSLVDYQHVGGFAKEHAR
jgi:hypothetical protein